MGLRTRCAARRRDHRPGFRISASYGFWASFGLVFEADDAENLGTRSVGASPDLWCEQVLAT